MILSSQTSQTILSRIRASKTPSLPTKTPQTTDPDDNEPLFSIASQQRAHTRENLYRACASITTFRVQDPDPNAVDSGRILGVRIDVSSSGKFIKPYYIFLNKPFPGSDLLRVHRHTLPPCIPVDALAKQHLPTPKVAGELVKGKKQSLQHFMAAVRREAVGYHNRTAVIKTLRKEFRLDEEVEKSSKEKGKQREKVIIDVSAADAEAKQVRIEWVDGRIGRCVVGEKGEVKKCVIIGEDGRDREVERRVLGVQGESKMEGIGERLREGIY
jgi:central kinetochore subunit Mal2/MCM21